VLPDDHGKLLGAIHARVPMVIVDEQQAEQMETAESEVRFWNGMRDMSKASADDQRSLAAMAMKAAEALDAGAADAEQHAKEAQERVERIRRGESVPPSKRQYREDVERELIASGFMTRADIRHMAWMQEFYELLGSALGDKEAAFEEFVKERFKAKDYTDRFQRAAAREAARAVLKRRGLL
jgi:hypothetical protein